MGTWGPGIYQNDTSADVKDYFVNQLHLGKSTREITDALTQKYDDKLTTKQEQQDFWCALADVQWKMGRLLPNVKDKAMAYLGGNQALLDWQFASSTERRKRFKTLQELSERLSSQQPEEKKISKYRLYHCPWAVGDVFGLPLWEENKENVKISKQFLLIEKVGTTSWYPGHEIPVVYLKITHNQSIPNTKDEYEQLDYIKLQELKADLRFLPVSDNEPDAIKNMRNSVDQDWKLSVFRVALITTSKRIIPKDIQFVGNFQTTKHPIKEYIPDWEVNIPAKYWSEIDDVVSNCCVLYHNQTGRYNTKKYVRK